MRKIFSFVAIYIFLFVIFSKGVILAQEATPTPTPTVSSDDAKVQDLQKQIADLQDKISSLQGQKKTLSSQISVMDSQIRLTQLRISATKQEIATLTKDITTTTKKIDNLEKELDMLTEVVLNRIVATYEVGSLQTFQILFASNGFSDFLSRVSYLRIAQANDKKLIYEAQQAKIDYANQKEIFENKKVKVESLQKQLVAYTTQLDQDKKSKQVLLDVTNNDEAHYQKLLQEAQAQIQAFKSFASFQGGASILPPQPSPDGWYYNQRDERWGKNLIGSSPEQVWAVGCLVTSVAMVMKQSGSSVNPLDIAANSSYFFSNTAYMLLPWGGGKFSSTWGYDQGAVDGRLSSGKPVIVGLKAGVYGMHFVVLKSGANGDYVMNDPWNGPNLKFTDHYSTGQIFQYGFYSG